MSRRRGRPTGRNPYTTESINAPTQQHPIIRNLGGYAIGNPALDHIIAAADELAEKLGKPVNRLTDDEARQAIETGRQRHRDAP